MADTHPQGTLPRSRLTDDERDAIASLTALCNAHEGLDLKVVVGLPRPEASAQAGDFLYSLDGRLVGYCSLDSSVGPTPELCGMVHPDYRRRGIGRALLNA